MNLNRINLAKIIKALKTDRFNLPTAKTLSKCVAEEHNIEADDTLENVMKKELCHFKRTSSYSSTEVILDTANFEANISSVECDIVKENSPKRRKSLLDVSRKTLLRRTNDIMEEVELLAEKEGVKCCQILGLLLSRCKDADADCKEIGRKLWISHENLLKTHNVCRKLALNCHIMVMTNLCTGGY